MSEAITASNCFMKITYRGENTGAAQDRHTFCIEAPSQPFEVNGRRNVETLTLTIVGNCELEDFLSAMRQIAAKLGTGDGWPLNTGDVGESRSVEEGF